MPTPKIPAAPRKPRTAKGSAYAYVVQPLVKPALASYPEKWHTEITQVHEAMNSVLLSMELSFACLRPRARVHIAARPFAEWLTSARRVFAEKKLDADLVAKFIGIPRDFQNVDELYITLRQYEKGVRDLWTYQRARWRGLAQEELAKQAALAKQNGPAQRSRPQA